MKRFLPFACIFFYASAALAQPVNVTVGSSDISGTVASGGTYQTVAVFSIARRNCTIQNPANATEVLSVKLGTMAQPYVLQAGTGLSTLNGTVNAGDALTVTAATTGHAYAGTCQ